MAKQASVSIEEQETTFTVEATDRNTLYVFSNDPTWIRRLDGITESYREDSYGKFYKLDLSEFTFTLRPKRKMTEEQKRASAERLQTARLATK
jgi:hypothetical protein